MTPTISDPVKKRISAHEFNCGYLILARVTALNRPTGDNEFMRLIKEYYTLRYTNFDTITDYLTHIKLLEERIAVTNVVLISDKQTILCLTISLPDDLQYLTKI